MATGNLLLGTGRRKLGDVVFYRSGGQQRARVRVRTIKNPRSEKQSVQRCVLATASKTLAALRPLYNHSFQNVAVGTMSERYALKLLMNGYRAAASTFINGGGEDYKRAVFALKGAPIAAFLEGMPMSRGGITINDYEFINSGNNRGQLTLAISSQLTETAFSTQEAYAAELAKLGLEAGDQLTVVLYAQNVGLNVAESDKGINKADCYRYARITFVPELPQGFSGTLISNGAFNPALIASSEGLFPAVSTDEYNAKYILVFDVREVLPTGYASAAGAIVRSQKTAAGATLYSNSDFVVDSLFETTIFEAFPSYAADAGTISVGDTLYLKNAEAAPFV